MAISAILPNANEVSGWNLIPAAAYAASDVTAPWNVDRFSSAEIVVTCTAITGTLNVYVQELLPDKVTYGDVASFTQIAGAATLRLSFIHGGNSMQAPTDATLAAGTILTVNMGGWWRLKFVIATGPATFRVDSNWKA